MERYLCLHGHFYQPPRENPWLEAVERQDSAHPFHDWNERITSECYWPNAAARILDRDGYIRRITSNYQRMSFNFGPTLLSWMEAKHPDVYRAIQLADATSVQQFGGHGSAMAQAYNHMILPLANPRDKLTQVRWGIRDFEHRFGRVPEGMWLAETAVDTPSLEALAAEGIKFTVLAPRQAKRVRHPHGQWAETSDGRLDTRRPYRVALPSGKSIAVFFYHGPIAQAVAFENLLADGVRFANRLIDSFDDRQEPQLVHIATDGETYGHHHRHGEMALAYALHHIEERHLAHLTNYGEYLARFPPAWEAEIVEESSWSCAHGVGRWRRDCGCTNGGREWNQRWRAPLRESLDQLRDALAPVFEQRGAKLFKDPWAARDGYIDVILDRSPHNVSAFFTAHARHELGAAERVDALRLLEMQRHAQLMFTSCGWFFDDISRIEGVQILRYAARAIQLCRVIGGPNHEEAFLEKLAQAESNVPERGSGATIYASQVRSQVVDLPKLVAHYAVHSLFEGVNHSSDIYCYGFESETRIDRTAGRLKLAMGRATVTSQITEASDTLAYGVLHFGDHNITGGVRHFHDQRSYERMVEEVMGVFDLGDLPATLRKLDTHFLELTYSLDTLFKDEQHRVVEQLLQGTLDEAEAIARHVYKNHAPLLAYVSTLDYTLPKPLRSAIDFQLNATLIRELGRPELDVDRIRAVMEETKRFNVKMDEAGIRYAFEQRIRTLSQAWRESPSNPIASDDLERVIELARSFPFDVDMSRAQEAFFEVRRGKTRSAQLDRLGERLRIRAPDRPASRPPL